MEEYREQLTIHNTQKMKAGALGNKSRSRAAKEGTDGKGRHRGQGLNLMFLCAVRNVLGGSRRGGQRAERKGPSRVEVKQVKGKWERVMKGHQHTIVHV